MRQVLDHGRKASIFASLALALLIPGIVRAGSAPLVLVAQEHNVEHEKQKGVFFHVTAYVNNLKGKPCALAVYSFDTTGKPRKSLRKDFTDEEGWLRTTSRFTPIYDFTQINGKLFMPYDAITKERGLFKARIVANVFDEEGKKWLAAIPFRADCWFAANADKAEVERSAKRFVEERETVAKGRKLYEQRKQAEFMALLAKVAEHRRADQRRAEQLRHADRLAEQRRADHLADQRRADQRRADQLAEQRRADQRRADQLAAQRREEQRRADQLAAQRRAEEARRRR